MNAIALDLSDQRFELIQGKKYMQFTKNGTKAQKFKAILYEILKELDQ
jgi:hypothetical protein